MLKQGAKDIVVEVEQVAALITSLIARRRECIAACDRAAQSRERTGNYTTQEIDRFVALERESSEADITAFERLLLAIHPEQKRT